MPEFEAIFDRIKAATNTRTQVELAEVLDIRQSSISDAKRRSSIPSDWYVKLFEKYGLNPDWLKRGDGPMYLRKEGKYGSFDEPMGKVAEIGPKYEEPDSKGVIVTVYGMDCDGSDAEGWDPRPTGKLIIPKPMAGPNLKVLRMDAGSMAPTVRKGAYVGLDTSKRRVASGELYGVYVPFEGLTLKRIFLDETNERFVLKVDDTSREYPEQHLEVDKQEQRIIGRAVWVMQGF